MEDISLVNSVVLGKEKSTLHSGKSALGPLVLERIVVNLMVNVFSKLYLHFPSNKVGSTGCFI